MSRPLVLAPVLCLIGVLGAASSARILALFTTPSHSHHFWNVQYLEAVASRGHNVTYLGLDEYKSPPHNLRHVHLGSVYETLYAGFDPADMQDMGEMGPFTLIYVYNMWEDMTSRAIIKDPQFQTFQQIVRSEEFDLIVTDLASTGFTLGAAAPLGYPPVLGITAFSIPPWAPAMVGSPLPYTDAPHAFLTCSNKMSFWERLTNYILAIFSQYCRQLHMDKQDTYSKEVFGQSTKHLNDIIQNMNIVLVNWNLSLDPPFAAVPGMVHVGGLHIKKPKQLPSDLQQYLDSAKDGAIYFSLGSNVQSSTLDPSKIQIFNEAFKRLAPIKVLWKWETDHLPGKPDNVEVRKWLPQNDILAHENVKLFFTHSGLLSTQEATYHGVPIVGMPFFLDQHVNIKKCVRKGVGEQLSLETITAQQVYDTISKVLQNPTYRENMKNLSAIFRDNMNEPLERAMYWTEYAIRHKGAGHLRPASRDLPWYQNWLLDVLLVLGVGPLVLLYLIAKLSTKILAAVFTKPKVKKN